MLDLGWWPTTIVLGLAGALLLWSRQVSLKAPDPLRPRMLNHGLVQMVAFLVVLMMLAHMVTLIAGQPLTGRR